MPSPLSVSYGLGALKSAVFKSRCLRFQSSFASTFAYVSGHTRPAPFPLGAGLRASAPDFSYKLTYWRVHLIELSSDNKLSFLVTMFYDPYLTILQGESVIHHASLMKVSPRKLFEFVVEYIQVKTYVAVCVLYIEVGSPLAWLLASMEAYVGLIQ